MTKPKFKHGVFGANSHHSPLHYIDSNNEDKTKILQEKHLNDAFLMTHSANSISDRNLSNHSDEIFDRIPFIDKPGQQTTFFLIIGIIVLTALFYALILLFIVRFGTRTVNDDDDVEAGRNRRVSYHFIITLFGSTYRIPVLSCLTLILQESSDFDESSMGGDSIDISGRITRDERRQALEALLDKSFYKLSEFIPNEMVKESLDDDEEKVEGRTKKFEMIVASDIECENDVLENETIREQSDTEKMFMEVSVDTCCSICLSEYG